MCVGVQEIADVELTGAGPHSAITGGLLQEKVVVQIPVPPHQGIEAAEECGHKPAPPIFLPAS